MNRYYVYAYIVDGVVRYVGKGSTFRLQQHMQIVRRIIRRRSAGLKVKAEYFHNKLCKAYLAGSEIEPRILVEGLTEPEAYARERAEIAAAPIGQLWNQKAGGDSGVTYGPEYRKRISDGAKRRYQDPAQRAQASIIASQFANSPEARAKRAKTQRARWDAGDPAMLKFTASSHTPEVYAKRGKTLKRTLAENPAIVQDWAEKSSAWWSKPENNEAMRAKLSAAHARPEVKAKRRAYWDSPEGRENLRRASAVSAAKKKALAAQRKAGAA